MSIESDEKLLELYLKNRRETNYQDKIEMHTLDALMRVNGPYVVTEDSNVEDYVKHLSDIFNVSDEERRKFCEIVLAHLMKNKPNH
jgi:hypothetical protein